MRETEPYYVFKKIESLRYNLLHNYEYINITDYGTGLNRSERIANIAYKSLKKPSQAQLLFRIVKHVQAEKILELGTSLGITTMYLSASSSKIQCQTIEGCPAISSVARQNFKKLGLKNIKLINAKIEDVLKQTLEESGKQDFIYIDANHRYEAVLQYFEICLNYIHEKSILVLDDIYWSSGMEKAWKKIQTHPQVTASIDMFHMGLVFFDSELNNKSYKVFF